MFFFGKKKPKAQYVCYMSKILKYKNVLKTFSENPKAQNVILLYFFDQTRVEMGKLLEVSGIRAQDMAVADLPTVEFNFLNARELKGKYMPKADAIYVLELHPFFSINEIPMEAMIDANDKEMMELIYFSGMDEIIPLAFPDGKLVNMMAKLNMDENEAIEHSMVTKSLQRATQKIEADINVRNDVRSSLEEWIAANVI